MDLYQIVGVDFSITRVTVVEVYYNKHPDTDTGTATR